ncbi:MAG: hypothetical protein DDT35_00690 [Firmicutes bacterium]|nr:hypothetical protein [Bacillota bacterium]
MGLASLRLNNYLQATVHLRRAHELAPQDVDILRSLGEAYERAEKKDEAVLAREMAGALDAQSPHPHFNTTGQNRDFWRNLLHKIRR